MTTSLIRIRSAAAAIAAFVLLLSACATPTPKKEQLSGATVRSLNYSAREVADISVEKPGDPSSGGGGDVLNPYSAGGYMCCFAVPSVWRPDLQVVVKYKFYPEKEFRSALVNVPPYPNGKAGDIWLIVHEDESAEAVVSLYGPSRDEWPGKVRGYPVPSREYRLKLWERAVNQAKSDVEVYKKQIAEFSKEGLERTWEFRMKHQAKELKEFTGPSDPAFSQYLMAEYNRGLSFFSTRLDSLLKNKP